MNLPKKKSGFTIIEVLIVLAIVGLIMSILFVAIPSLNARARDNGRKSAVRTAYTQLLEFKVINRGFPACDVGVPGYGCNTSHQTAASKFLTDYIGDIIDPDTGNPLKDSSFVTTGSVVRTDSSSVIYIFDAGSVDHTQVPNTDQILIVSGHWCYLSKPDDGPATNPIASNSLYGPDLQVNKAAVLIGTERSSFYCIDNY